MLAIRENRLLRITDEEFIGIRKTLRITRSAINVVIDNILIWFKAQEHLPKIDLDRDFVERLFIMQKCSTQRTKEKISMIYTARTLMPDIFLKRNPRSHEFTEAMDTINDIPLPYLTSDLSRVMLIRINGDSSKFHLLDTMRMAVMTQEIRSKEDYALGITLLVDIANASTGHILKCNPIILSRCENAMKRVLGVRVFALHIINGSRIAEKVVTLLKQCLRPKLAARINVHYSLEDVYLFIPKSILPKDYGGDLPTLQYLADDWKKHMASDDVFNYFKEQDKHVCEEDHQGETVFQNNITGTTGSFRKLDID